MELALKPRDPKSGDGWLEGPNGEIRWGLFGAAGAFLFNPATDRLLLQKRAIWTAQGGTWGIPGGAIAAHESPLEGALRETEEETGLDSDFITIHNEYKIDLGWWSYTTFVGTVEHDHEVVFDDESETLEWLLVSELSELPLHSAFASALPELLELIADLRES